MNATQCSWPSAKHRGLHPSSSSAGPNVSTTTGRTDRKHGASISGQQIIYLGISPHVPSGATERLTSVVINSTILGSPRREKNRKWDTWGKGFKIKQEIETSSLNPENRDELSDCVFVGATDGPFFWRFHPLLDSGIQPNVFLWQEMWHWNIKQVFQGSSVMSHFHHHVICAAQRTRETDDSVTFVVYDITLQTDPGPAATLNLRVETPGHSDTLTGLVVWQKPHEQKKWKDLAFLRRTIHLVWGGGAALGNFRKWVSGTCIVPKKKTTLVSMTADSYKWDMEQMTVMWSHSPEALRI